ncbi:MAG: endonuclease/exonuclease/phosphatase family protein [Spirosoma sp.]|nr:endonuclease/exonuclease/phosphatase family protein [Spirosoma sp.]
MTSSLLIVTGCSVLLIMASFVHLLRIDYWWIRIWDFPHLQLGVLTLICLAGWIALGVPLSWPMALVPAGLLAAAVYQSWLIFPYTAAHPRQMQSAKHPRLSSRDAHQFRLLTANVYMENTRTGELLALVDESGPDVVLLLEANAYWYEGMKPLEVNYPYQIAHPLENTYGILMYSRLPMREEQVRFLIEDNIPSISVQFRLPSGQWIQFYGVHPTPPSPTENYRSTERDAELLVVGKECRLQTRPTVVAGDLNDVAWSHTTRLFQRVSGLLDPRIGRGLFSTFHAKYPFLRWPLDHVFASTHFQLQTLKRMPGFGSDHFPIMVTLVCEERPQGIVEKPHPEHDDLKEASEIIEKAGQ